MKLSYRLIEKIERGDDGPFEESVVVYVEAAKGMARCIVCDAIYFNHNWERCICGAVLTHIIDDPSIPVEKSPLGESMNCMKCGKEIEDLQPYFKVEGGVECTSCHEVAPVAKTLDQLKSEAGGVVGKDFKYTYPLTSKSGRYACTEPVEGGTQFWYINDLHEMHEMASINAKTPKAQEMILALWELFKDA